jgi:hypothetical protein
MRIGVDAELQLFEASEFEPLGRTDGDRPQYWLGKRISSPPYSPVFQELEPDMGFRYPITLVVHSSVIVGERIFELTTSTQAPGFRLTESWRIHSRAGLLEMWPPGHPLNS